MASRYRLWVDGCGGFLLVVGDRVTVGRGEHASPLIKAVATKAPAQQVDVGVIGDWPRLAGQIDRRGESYFWSVDGDDSATVLNAALLNSGARLPVAGSVAVTISNPSPLSTTAVLSIAAPHRFAEHVDAVVLVDQTVVIGATADCHVRVRDAASRSVLIHEDGSWWLKTGTATSRRAVGWNDPVVSDDFSIVLEKA